MAAEAANGQSGGRFTDIATGLRFAVPEGWNLQPPAGGAFVFNAEDGRAVIQLNTQDIWRRFGAARRDTYAQQGLSREGADTRFFGDSLKTTIRGSENMTFTEAEFSGILFYCAETATDQGEPVTIRLGASKGSLIVLIGVGEAAGAGIGAILNAISME